MTAERVPDKTFRARFNVRVPSAGIATGDHLFLFTKDSPEKARGLYSDNHSSAVTRLSILASQGSSQDDILVDGNLEVEVDIQSMLKVEPPASIGVRPPDAVGGDLLKMLDSEGVCPGDVTFKVGRKGADGDHEIFRAHSLILSARSPFLADLASGNDGVDPIPLSVDPEIFRIFLRFIYGGEVPDTTILSAKAEEILRFADFVDCENLKRTAEWELGSSVNVENAVERLLLANGNNCDVLKKATNGFFVANMAAIRDTEGYQRLRESEPVLFDVLETMVPRANISNNTSPADVNADAQRIHKSTGDTEAWCIIFACYLVLTLVILTILDLFFG